MLFSSIDGIRTLSIDVFCRTDASSNTFEIALISAKGVALVSDSRHLSMELLQFCDLSASNPESTLGEDVCMYPLISCLQGDELISMAGLFGSDPKLPFPRDVEKALAA